MREEVLPWLGTGGCPPSDYDAPFEAEGNGFPAALNPCRHVDEAGVERQQGVWLGSPAVPSRLIVDETSLMTSSAEKVCMRPPVAGDSLIQVVPWLVHELVLLGLKVGLDKQCKTQPKGDVFPLPTNMLHLRDIMGVDLGIVGMVRGMCLALNLFYGVPAENDFHPTSLQVEAVRHLAREAQVASEWPERLEQISWQEFFHLKTIDYCGDEVLCAQSTTWANLAPAMPAEIASVALADVCELGCKHYVENFSEYLLPGEMQQAMKGPRVLVHDDHWREVCEGLTRNVVCTILPKSQVYHVQGQPLLNGLFGVKKDEIVDGLPVHRLIMDLRPCNNVCRGLEGDVATLPSWATMGPLQLMPTEDLVVSSEDVRCFFYIFKVPQEWHPFLAFNKPLPRDMWPGDDGPYYIASQVLPMGFKNSVSLAQHVHRNIVRMASTRTDEGLRPEQEVRKDRPFSASSVLHRIYLDNFDQLEKVPKNSHELLVGECSPGIMALRAEYESWGVPRRPKKAVSRSLVAEVQGAIIDGNLGIAYAKPSKVYKYTGLSILFLKETMSSQKQVQVIAGGLVYLSMFRRPLLGSLNNIWRFVEAFRGYPPVVKLPIPDGVKLEVARFLCLIPLARLDFRLSVSSEVTASDASTSGGGLTVSTGLTGFGIAASQTVTRGDVAEPGDLHGVLTVGLFDGIGALRVAADACGLAVVGHISVEVNKAASRVLESRFPATVFVEGGVEAVAEEEVQRWACQFSQASLVLIGAGPPCQGVSGLNADRRGALRELVKQKFKWAQVRYLAESVASMDSQDRKVMTTSFGDLPARIDASGVSLARRPRLYWCNWELRSGPGVSVQPLEESGDAAFRTVELTAEVATKLYLQPGCSKASAEPYPTFTTSRPRDYAGRRPAGLDKLSREERLWWEEDAFRFPPYQYQWKLMVVDARKEPRLPDIQEREVIMGFPRDYTMQCMPKQMQGSPQHLDERKTLIGNSRNVTVVTWLISQLGGQLGLCSFLSPQQAVDRTAPGSSGELMGLLYTPPMQPGRKQGAPNGEHTLVRKLLNLVSLKGEDIMLQAPTEDTLRYHRLRASLPARLWKWRTVMGWQWSGSPEHINVLELRAVLTSIRWRILKRRAFRTKMVHMIDSLVCLHCLVRGRSSSRKMRRTLSRIDALLLASGSHGVWAYVHTSQNPADRPSRRPVKKKW